MPVVTADTNILVSGLHFGGAGERFLSKVVAGEFELAVSEPILAETRKVLREKFAWPEAELEDAERFLRGFARVVTPTQTLDVVREDPDDNRILECAKAAGAEVIVTGDKDLLRLGIYEGIQMVRLGDFLQRGQSQGR